ncbi:unknown [Prevotella sp. CAG:1092]|nr:unknown [Prevotella sp. CAG:1092]
MSNCTVWMKLVTGTYSSFIHVVSSLIAFSLANSESAACFPFTLMRSAAEAIMVLMLSPARMLSFFANAGPAMRALSGRPVRGLETFTSSSSSLSSPFCCFFFLSASRALRSSASFCEARANFLASISSAVIGTLRLKPTLYL